MSFFPCLFRLLFIVCFLFLFIFFFKQKTAYEMRISDWSSDVCSSDLFIGVEHLTDRELEKLLDQLEHDFGGTLAPASRTHQGLRIRLQIGRASCRERVCQYV